MAEDYEMPGLEKSETIRRKVLKGADEVHDRFKKLNEAFGIEWTQKEAGPSIWRKAYDYLKRRMEMYGEPKIHFEPEYSESEKTEREAMKESLAGLEEYNPKDSQRKTKVMETLFGTGREKMKSRFKPEYFPEEEMEKKKWKWRLERFEPYNPKDSKEHGAKDWLMDIGAAIAKVKLGHGDTEDRLDNYVELDELMGGAGLPEEKGPKLRKSYGLEADGNKLLGRRKISELSQYAPEHPGRLKYKK